MSADLTTDDDGKTDWPGQPAPNYLDAAMRQLEGADGFLRSARHSCDRVQGDKRPAALALSEKLTRVVATVFRLQESLRQIIVPEAKPVEESDS